MKKVIVTGANGFIGSSLIRKLVEKEISVVAIDLSFLNSQLPESTLISKIETGLGCVDALIEAIPVESYDALYHFAWAGVNGALKADPVVQLKNMELTMNCVSVASKLNVKKMLCAGTIAERATESLSSLESISGGMMYGVAKHATHLMFEAYCKNIGLKHVWMQFSNIYGPSNRTGNLISYTLGELMQGKEATFGPALQPYDFIFIEDLIEAAVKLGENETRENNYFIGSGSPRILKDYLIEIGEKVDKKELIKIDTRPDDGIKYTFEMFDTAALVRDIGNYITKSFSEGIDKTIEAFMGK